jgi:hypothetical protein
MLFLSITIKKLIRIQLDFAFLSALTCYISSKVQDANNISQQHELDKYQQEMIDFYHAAFAKIMEITLMDCWNYFWSQTLPITNRITEIYAAILNRLVNDTKTASKTANEVIFANIEVFSAAILEK